VTRILGVDYGSKRVGLAISDGLGMTASPLDVVARGAVVEYATNLSKETELGKIVVGLPTSLGGAEGTTAEAARKLGAELGEATGLPVHFHDERFTSRMAESSLLESGMKRRERRSKVDKVAAALILQDYLDHNDD
jgi:putative Holliday junction resolvase